MDRADEARGLRAEADRVYAVRRFYCFSAWHDWAAGLTDWDLGDLPAALALIEGAHRRLLEIGAAGAAAEILPDLAAIRRAVEGRPMASSVTDALAEPVAFRRARALESLAPTLPVTQRARVLEQAERLYDSLPAQRHRDRVLRALRAQGSAGGRSARRVGELTPRELAVARLAAAGASAQEIGQALHLSARTVEPHLAHVYGKLGIGGRRELKAQLAHCP